MGILDLVFPKYCVSCKKLGSYICPDCFSSISFDVKEICLMCGNPAIFGLTHPRCKTRYSIDGAFSSIVYKGIIKKLIYQFKYRPFLSDLKKVLSDLFYEGLIQNEEFYRVLSSTGDFILIPIPISKKRERERGYNQAEILARELALKLELRAENLVERKRETKSQFGLSKEKRKDNLENAFSLAPNIPARDASQSDAGGLISKYPNAFLVDDILTTGSTLVEACNVLKRSGAKRVYGLTLARD